MKQMSLRFPEAKSEQERVAKRRELLSGLGVKAAESKQLFSWNFPEEEVAAKNIENLIGSVAIPVGVAGPVKVVGEDLNEEILLPMATTEGALVASFNRGCKVISEAGGAQVVVKKIGITRAPVFGCADGAAAEKLVGWLEKNKAKLAKVCEETSSHLKFLDFKTWMLGRYVYVRFVFDPDQAMGMNMASIALQHLWDSYLSKNDQLKKWGVELVSLSSNVCADKKASEINQLLGRGYEVRAEVVVPKKVVKQLLKVEPKEFVHTHVVKNLHGSNLAGSTAQNMHFANGLAALFLAMGQDVAHVAESAQGNTVAEVVNGDLYVAVRLPDLPLGVVGGGTWLPAQSQARRLVRFGKKLSAAQLAAAVGAGILAGELSGIAALTNHTLAAAHQKLARKQS